MQTTETQANTETLSATAAILSLNEGLYVLEFGGLESPQNRALGLVLPTVQISAPPLGGVEIIGAAGEGRAWLGPDGDTVVVKAPPGGGQVLVTTYGLPENANGGLEPQGFTFWRTGQGAPAEWRVVDDSTATKQKAIAQTSKDTTDYRFPLAVYTPVSAKNVDVVIRFKPVAGKVDQAGGIAVRLTTPDDYYVARANALEDNVNFYRVVKGRRSQIKGLNTKVAGNQWHTLGLRAEGDRFTVSFDGRELFSAEDTTLRNEGKIALWTKADSVTHFDTITIRPLP